MFWGPNFMAQKHVKYFDQPILGGAYAPYAPLESATVECHPEKKMTETASLRVAHESKFPLFFFSGDSSITKQNK
jgi:hypothetical protein